MAQILTSIQSQRARCPSDHRVSARCNDVAQIAKISLLISFNNDMNRSRGHYSTGTHHHWVLPRVGRCCSVLVGPLAVQPCRIFQQKTIIHRRGVDCTTRGSRYITIAAHSMEEELGGVDTSVSQQQQWERGHGVAVATIVGCPFCKKVKDALSKAKIDYEHVDMSDKGVDVLNRCKELTGMSTVPQVFVGGRLIGGATETIQMIEDGSLFALVKHTGGKSVYSEELYRVLFDDSERTQSNGMSYGATVVFLKGIQDAYCAALQHSANDTTVELFKDLEAWVDRQEGKYGSGHDVLASMLKYKILLDMGDEGFVWSSHVPIISGAVTKKPLNSHITLTKRNEVTTQDPVQMSESLRSLLLELYDDYFTSDGSAVNYKGLREDVRFRAYVDATADLQTVDLSRLESRESKLCFWINMYNSLIVHALTMFGPARSTLERLTWFGDVSYTIGGYRFSANDIEHGVLRANASSPASLWNIIGFSQLAKPIFSKTDPRREFVISQVDPRIHFALNCGAKSCPPIKVYGIESLEAGLDGATRAFCESEITFDETKNELWMSSIFKWYGIDFGSTLKERLDFLLPYMSLTTRRLLENIMNQGQLDCVQVKYKNYDWGLNEFEQ